MSNRTRRKDKGLPGNGGKFTTTEHAEADASVGLGAPQTKYEAFLSASQTKNESTLEKVRSGEINKDDIDVAMQAGVISNRRGKEYLAAAPGPEFELTEIEEGAGVTVKDVERESANSFVYMGGDKVAMSYQIGPALAGAAARHRLGGDVEYAGMNKFGEPMYRKSEAVREADHARVRAEKRWDAMSQVSNTNQKTYPFPAQALKSGDVIDTSSIVEWLHDNGRMDDDEFEDEQHSNSFFEYSEIRDIEFSESDRSATIHTNNGSWAVPEDLEIPFVPNQN